MPAAKPVILCILDGVGLGRGGVDDAVATAPTPVLDHLQKAHPTVALKAHGTAVGLPSDGDMGNSEVGHNAMGAARVVDQGAKLVDRAFAAGTLAQTEVWQALCSTSTLHLLGLVSDGNVHSNVTHLNQLIDLAVAAGVTRLRVHVLTDGRDVSPRSALTWVEPLETKLAELSKNGLDYRVGSGGGRMHITMDRYQADWEMVARGYRCHVHGEGKPFSSASEAIRTLYEADPNVDDQWLPAFVVTENGAPVGRITDGDGVLFFNFRGDRGIEISMAFEDDDFPHFDRGDRPNVTYAAMMQYDGDLLVPKRYLVDPPAIDDTVGERLAAAGVRSFVISETQKFGHVTYFFNGNRSGRFDEALETYVEVPSDVVPFDERPWMKAAEITDAVIEAIESGAYDHIRLNYANGDMVGHTGNLRATQLAMQVLDLQLERLWQAVEKAGGVLLVTADHGNADQMYQRDKKSGDVKTNGQGQPIPLTSHTLAPVPFIVASPTPHALANVDDAGIASIGSTLLQLLGVEVPAHYAPGLIRS
ncbi:MAG: 2,3-bisphosphoglycerate-independent phosphoglycerate mutase [Myxococcota bacterium]